MKYDSETRMTRGIELLERGVKITEQQDGSFAVPSLTRNSIYEVILLKSVWVCDCPDFQFREAGFVSIVYGISEFQCHNYVILSINIYFHI